MQHEAIISQLLQQNTLLMDMMCEMQKKIDDLHRLFNAPPPTEPEKKLTSKQKIALEIEKRQKANELKITQEILREVK